MEPSSVWETALKLVKTKIVIEFVTNIIASNESSLRVCLWSSKHTGKSLNRDR